MTLRSRFLAGAAALVAAGSLAALPAPPAEPGDPVPPALRLPSGAAPLSYVADLTIDPARETLEGKIEIELRFDRPTPLLWLNANELDIHEASLVVAGKASPAKVVPGGENFAGFAFDPPAPAGAARLRVSWTAKIEPTDTSGVFRQKVGEDWYVYTQFESIAARRAFPCFDEPSFKTPWQLTLRIPKGASAVSNTPVSTDTPVGALRVVTFARTKPLPPYLVAFGIGPFEYADAGRMGKNSIPVRIVVPRGRSGQTRWAIDIQKPTLERLEAYFGIPYPYEKLDHLVIPQTVRFGAMENPGLITWNEGILLSNPKEETVQFQRTAASINAHEVAHMWFGDYVTLAWWDDTWLNESFATWMAERILQEWKPEWRRDVVEVSDRSDTLDRDTIVSARQVRQPILSLGDIDNAFDDISYGKGGAVLSMFEAWVGPQVFQAGIRSYLGAHAWGNATSGDFLAALEKASSPGVGRAFSTFIDQPGFPLVTADLRCARGLPPRVLLRQKRLLPKGAGDSPALWRVPVCVRWGGGAGAGRACTLLAATSGEIELPGGAACPDWVLANAGERGYYRAAYAGDLLAKLLRGGAPQLTLVERVGVLRDVNALASLGEMPMDRALALVPAFSKDGARQVTQALIDVAKSVNDHLVPEEQRDKYQRFIRDSFGVRARQLGWTPTEGEGEDAELLRSELLSIATGAGNDPELRREGAALGRRWLDDRGAVAPGLAGLAVARAAREGDAALFDRMIVEAKKADQRDRRRILTALACFLDPALEKRALALILDPGFDARESIGILWTELGDRRTRDLAWEFFKANFDAIRARLPREYAPVLPRTGAYFCDRAHEQDFRAFFEPRVASIEGAARPFAQSLEEAGQCRALAVEGREGVARFLKAY